MNMICKLKSDLEVMQGKVLDEECDVSGFDGAKYTTTPEDEWHVYMGTKIPCDFCRYKVNNDETEL